MAICDITPLTDSLIFEPGVCFRPRMTPVRDNIYACVYQGLADNGYLVTFSVDTEGNISGILDTFVFESPDANRPDIQRVGEGIIAIVFEDGDSHGGLSTYAIDADGIINETRIDYYMFETGTARNCNIESIGIGIVYVIAYEDSSVRGMVKTVSIASNGTITHEVIDSLMFDAGNGGQPIIKDVLLNVFGIFYIGPLYDVKLCTIRIEDDGELGDAIIDSFVFERAENHQVDFCIILTGMLACVYRSDASHGRLKTIGCDGDGFFDAQITDSYDFPDANFAYPSISMIGAQCYAIPFQGVDDDGFIKTITITPAGDISADITDSTEFDTDHCVHSQLRHIQDGTCILVHEGDGDDGIARSMGIQPAAITVGRHELCMGIGP